MTIGCADIDTGVGVALRLAGFLDCQARALGENAFQALAGGPLATGLLSGLVTIFVALIGYRMILGGVPSLGDGVGWAVRLGFVLALVTSWPAYQTLVYRVAADAPAQLARLLLPAAGLPGEDLEARVQQAYDTIRLGSVTEQPPDPFPQAAAPGSPGQGQGGAAQAPASLSAQPPSPQTASVLVLSTVGVTSALRIATGFLLAVGPLALMSLLFDATLGLFSGWVRALAGAALAGLAATIVTAIGLVMVEGELARLQAYGAGGIAAVVDPQAITTLVLVFSLVMLVVTVAAWRLAGAFRQPPLSPARSAGIEPGAGRGEAHITGAGHPTLAMRTGDARSAAPSRASSIADALTSAARREQGSGVNGVGSAQPGRTAVIRTGARAEAAAPVVPLGVVGRRSIGRRSLSAARRDKPA